jgi:DNA polymerase I
VIRCWDAFTAIWVLDFEYHAPAGHRPLPVCAVATDVRSGRSVQLWGEELHHPPPFGCGSHEAIVSYNAPAELSCYLALGWPIPSQVIDLQAEFLLLTNTGREGRRHYKLLMACEAFGIPTIEASAKLAAQAVIIRGAPFTLEERDATLAYCASDVAVTAELFRRMRPRIDLPRALLRGRAMVALARVERTGIPINVPRLRQLQDRWDDIKHALVADMDKPFGVYDGLSFRSQRFEQYLIRHGIPWPRLVESGALDLRDSTFKDQASIYPQLNNLRELRSSLSKLRLNGLHIGPDDRNRAWLGPFVAKTGRNAPSSSAYMFGPAKWIRSLIRPEPGWGLAYIDWEHQEIGVAAALSRDPALQQAYRTGNPYIAFAIAVGAAPTDATKRTHLAVHERFKAVVLGLGYGMGADALGRRIEQPAVYAERLIRQHRATYPQFWRWAEAAQSYATATGSITSRFGWRLQVTPDTPPNTLLNYPMQANGGEVLRLASILLTEAGIRTCALVHDAVLIEAPLAELTDTILTAKRLMAEAAAIVLDGFPLRTEATSIRYPDQYDDPRGRHMVATLARLLPEPVVEVEVEA